MVTKSLAQKLYIRPGYTVALLNAPKGVAELLAPLPEEVTIVTKASVTIAKDKVDLVLCFVKNQSELEKSAKDLAGLLDESVVLWFAYPKLSSKTASDLTRDKGWTAIYELGFDGIASVAIDSVWSALRFKRRTAKSDEDLIGKHFAGDRAAFLPHYERLSSILVGLGPDVEVAPRQAYIAFSRSKQFALLKPARDRLDLVLKLPKAPLGNRLIAASNLGSGSMTHRVPITSLEDIDMQVIEWIHDAYRGVHK